MKVKSEREVIQSCPTLHDPMDCSLAGSSIHGIFQARVLEWGAIAFSDDKPRQSIKKQRHHFADKDVSSQSYGFPIVMYVWMWELDHKEGWVLENWYFWTMVLEKTLENFLNCKIKVINPKENQSWIFIGKTDAEPEAPTLWPPDVANRPVGKGPDSGKDWKQKEKGQHGLRWLNCITNSTNMNSGELQEIVKDKGACHARVQRVTKSGHKWTDA